MGLPLSKVLPTINEVISNLDYILYSVEEDKMGTNDVLRVFVQRSSFESVDLDDCVKITHELTKVLDEDQNLVNEYVLEVASPGIIRELKEKFHFEQVVNQNIEVKVKNITDNEDQIINDKLISVEAEKLVFENATIDFTNVISAKTTFEF